MSMMVSSVLPPLGLTCACHWNAEPQGSVVLQSIPKAPDAFQGDATKRFEFARGLAIVGMALASFCSLLGICGVLGWIHAMAVGGGISPCWREFSRACTWLKVTFVQEADLRSNRIRELVMKKRLRRATALLWVLYPICCLITMFECRQFWLHETSDQFLYESAVVPSMYLLMFTLLHQLKIQEVSPMWLDGLNVSLGAMWVCKYLVLGYWTGARDNLRTYTSGMFNYGVSNWGYTGLTGWMLFGRLSQGLLCGNAKLSVLLNVIVTAVDMHAHGVADPPFLLHYIHQQAGVCAAMSIIFCWDAQQLLAEAAALMDAKTSNSKYSLAQRVLGATCDAVAYLDVDLSLLGPCPKLAQMLLRHPTAVHEGSSFVDFLFQDDNDVDRVQYLMQEEVKASLHDPTKLDPAGIVHVHMVDADQNKVPVQLYWCCTAQMDGQVQHLVGISQDAELGEQDAETSQGQKGADTSLCPVREGKKMSFDSRIAVSVASSRSSASSAESADEEVQAAGEEISVCIDAASRALTFLGCSNAFMLLCGYHGPGSGLGEWLRDTTDAFTSWLSSSRSGAGFHKVVLQPPGFPAGRYEAHCRRRTLQPGRHAAAAEDASIDAVELIFDRVRLRTRDTKSFRKSCRRLQSQAPCVAVASPPHYGSACMDVGLPSCNILGIELGFGTLSGELFSSLKVGSSLQECLVKHRAFTALLLAEAERMPHGTLLKDAAAMDLGTWDLLTEDSGTLSVQLKLTGLKAPSSEAEPDSVVCQLNVQIRSRAAAPAGVAPGSAREAQTGLWITLGVGDTAGAPWGIIVITARSLEVRVLLGFDPLGQSFLPWLSCPRDSLQWEEVFREIEPDRTAPKAAVEMGEISLRPGQLVEHGWEIRAGCRCVILPRKEATSAKSDVGLFTMELRSAQRVRLRQSL